MPTFTRYKYIQIFERVYFHTSFFHVCPEKLRNIRWCCGGRGRTKKGSAATLPFSCPKRESNPHGFKGHWILSPARLPIPPSGQGWAHAGRQIELQSYCKILNLQKLLFIYACGRIRIGQKMGGHLAAGKLHSPEAEEQDGNGDCAA